MPRIVIIILWIQYLSWMVFRTTSTYTFGIIDLVLHLLFALQSIWLLFLIYMYINWVTADKLDEKTRTIVNSVVNLIILLAVIIFSLNILNVFLLDWLSNIF